ncbi:hypothetical protein H634G_09947 [Metarhizium anisopliae BRIP 53293]|uniref:Uncharacterized protein n=1 Tax=Metarhizium anisopliae BRIP 53293 TaxID=1291518 RepID=A0A0D9NL82_METAN|nr:hypothetical protein H634G_09947 [Metarhizium anisopliae BRIP 53293]KJK88392.1 hypothetical protein H633G_07732 [Metarhizium anisopliae BRIP 53284]
MSDAVVAIPINDEEAQNNERLKEIYFHTTQQEGIVGAWTGPHTITIRGPLESTTAVVMKRGRKGYVAVFRIFSETDHRPLVQYNASEGAVMIILESQHYCWIMEKAKVKYIE